MRFQAKHAKYSNLTIIKTAEAITTKFCTVIKGHLVLSVGCSKICSTNSKWADNHTPSLYGITDDCVTKSRLCGRGEAQETMFTVAAAAVGI